MHSAEFREHSFPLASLWPVILPDIQAGDLTIVLEPSLTLPPRLRLTCHPGVSSTAVCAAEHVRLAPGSICPLLEGGLPLGLFCSRTSLSPSGRAGPRWSPPPRGPSLGWLCSCTLAERSPLAPWLRRRSGLRVRPQFGSFFLLCFSDCSLLTALPV